MTTEPTLERLVANGTIKSYVYDDMRDYGDCHESLDITFPNGETLHIHSVGIGREEDWSALSIS
jgi:hypothetical protein